MLRPSGLQDTEDGLFPDTESECRHCGLYHGADPCDEDPDSSDAYWDSRDTWSEVQQDRVDLYLNEF